MLADLVGGGGCVAEGSEAVNNPLSRLGNSMLEAEQRRDLAGSSSQHAAMPGGPNSSGLLPSMGPSEAAFMHAFQGGKALQTAWESAAGGSSFASGGAPMGGPGFEEAMRQEAMMQEAMMHAFSSGGASSDAPPEHAAYMERLAMAWSGSAPMQHPADASHQAAPMQQRGWGFSGALPPPPAMHPGMHPGVRMERPQATMPMATPAHPPMGYLPPEEVWRLDAAHQAAWRSLAPRSEAGQSEAQRTNIGPRTMDMFAGTWRGAVQDSTLGQNAELQAADTPALDAGVQVRVFRDGQVKKGILQSEGATTSTAGSMGDTFEQMERVWRQLSIAEGTQSTHTSPSADVDASTADLDAIWQGLKGADYSAAWDDVWNNLAVDGAADNAGAPYRFQEANPHLGGTDLLARGIELFERGELREAVLVLEAAVQAQPQDSIAWQILGQAHADADDDAQAIACLRRAVAADPHNLDALLALGVSYTNELDQTRALQHLQLWLESHPDFAQLCDDERTAASVGRGMGPLELQRHVTELYLQAVKINPGHADLHAVLGVLHNLTRSYPEAIAAFETALKLRPSDYSLWNKLGATQANSMKCDSALTCYIRALELKPQYVRALSNLGISYGNLNNQEAAAQCYLKSLSLNPEATHIWGYLTMTFSAMGRTDLLDKAASADHELFRGDFDF